MPKFVTKNRDGFRSVQERNNKIILPYKPFSAALPSSSPPATVVYHSSASKRLAQARAGASIASSGSSESPSVSPGPQTYAFRSQGYPTDGQDTVQGVPFNLGFTHVYRNSQRLDSTRLGYAVRHKSQLKGGRELAAIWKHGIELAYIEEDGASTKLWLCRLCHLDRSRNDAKNVDSYHHITMYHVI